jgi:hypothetical protein
MITMAFMGMLPLESALNSASVNMAPAQLPVIGGKCRMIFVPHIESRNGSVGKT